MRRMLTYAAIWVANSQVQILTLKILAGAHLHLQVQLITRVQILTRKYKFWRSQGWQGLTFIYNHQDSKDKDTSIFTPARVQVLFFIFFLIKLKKNTKQSWLAVLHFRQFSCYPCTHFYFIIWHFFLFFSNFQEMCKIEAIMTKHPLYSMFCVVDDKGACAEQVTNYIN